MSFALHRLNERWFCALENCFRSRLLDISRRAELKRQIDPRIWIFGTPSPLARPCLILPVFVSLGLGNAFGLRLPANALEGQKRFSFGFNCN